MESGAARGADERYMHRTIALAERAAAAGDVPVGAVLVTRGVAYEAWNRREAEHDPTAHAEIVAIRAACAAERSWRLAGARLYVSKEPCVMCAGAIVAARIGVLVFGCRDPKAGAAGGTIDVFGSQAARHRVTVVPGMLAAETAAPLRRFFEARRCPEGPRLM